LNNPSAADTIISTTVKSSSSIGPHNKRILIVDDEEDIAYCFKIALECAGFIVDTFNDPIKSLSVYKAGAYDLLLLDIKCRGWVVLNCMIRLKRLTIKSMYVLLYEEYYDEIKKRFPHSEKTEWFIRKPIGMEALIRTVKSHLK
jgi:DNA-binding response OmpR family regulator